MKEQLYTFATISTLIQKLLKSNNQTAFHLSLEFCSALGGCRSARERGWTHQAGKIPVPALPQPEELSALWLKNLLETKQFSNTVLKK